MLIARKLLLKFTFSSNVPKKWLSNGSDAELREVSLTAIVKKIDASLIRRVQRSKPLEDGSKVL